MKYVLVDIDGTICDSSHRKDNFDDGDWKEDEPIEGMIELVRSLYNNLNWVVLMTCRKDMHRENTVEWLRKYDVPYHDLRMQENWMQRKDWSVDDCVIKWSEFCMLDIEPEEVLLAIDDKVGTVEMWRTNGINALLVQKAIDKDYWLDLSPKEVL